MTDLDSYEHTGDELLDSLDEIRAAEESVRYQLELFNERRLEHREEVPSESIEVPVGLEHAVRNLREAHQSIDEMFREEHPVFPIMTVSEREEGTQETGVAWCEIEMDSYQTVVSELEKKNGQMSERTPGMNYGEVPAPIAMIDYSDELIDTYHRVENTYSMVEETGLQNLLNGDRN